MKPIFPIFSLLVLASMAACGVSPGASPGPVASPMPYPTASATPSLPAVTAVEQITLQPGVEPSQDAQDTAALQEVLKNSTFTAPNYNKTITLRDGKFEAGTGADYLLVQMLPQMAFGDLNQDGQIEGAVLLGENGGGSGVFVSLIAVTLKGGVPVQAGTALVDDRPKIRGLSIKDGQIILDALIHGPADAMVNPTLPVIETYQIVSGDLVLTRLVSKTPDGQDRTINISSPAGQAEVKGSVKVTGTMSIAPLEKNLLYRIYDENGKKLAEGPFPLKAGRPGVKVAFENTIRIPPIASGSAIRLELSDSSLKDGSQQALTSVFLVTK